MRKKKSKIRRSLRRRPIRRPKRRIVKIKKRRPKMARKKNVTKSKPTIRYILNNGFEFLYELRDLVLKSSPAEKERMIERINRLGRIKLAIISGVFMNKENADPTIADLLIVGDDIENRKLRSFLKSLEAEVGKEIKFAVLEKDEFQYRLSMFDRFIRVLLESPHEKLINKIGL